MSAQNRIHLHEQFLTGMTGVRYTVACVAVYDLSAQLGPILSTNYVVCGNANKLHLTFVPEKLDSTHTFRPCCQRQCNYMANFCSRLIEVVMVQWRVPRLD